MSASTAPRRLRSDDDLSAFECGVEVVDRWVRERARHAERQKTAVVYVSLVSGNVAGIYTLSPHSIDRGKTSGWLAHNAPNQVPVILLGMLGVDRAHQGHGLGSSLLADAIERSLAVSCTIGARALLVDPAGEEAEKSFSKHGFRRVPGSDRLFIPLSIT